MPDIFSGTPCYIASVVWCLYVLVPAQQALLLHHRVLLPVYAGSVPAQTLALPRQDFWTNRPILIVYVHSTKLRQWQIPPFFHWRVTVSPNLYVFLVECRQLIFFDAPHLVSPGASRQRIFFLM